MDPPVGSCRACRVEGHVQGRVSCHETDPQTPRPPDPTRAGALKNTVTRTSSTSGAVVSRGPHLPTSPPPHFPPPHLPTSPPPHLPTSPLPTCHRGMAPSSFMSHHYGWAQLHVTPLWLGPASCHTMMAGPSLTVPWMVQALHHSVKNMSDTNQLHKCQALQQAHSLLRKVTFVDV